MSMRADHLHWRCVREIDALKAEILSLRAAHDSSEQTIREQCAKIAESYYDPKESNDFILARIEIAAAIRGGK